MKDNIINRKRNYVKYVLLLFFISILTNSCLFDKEIRQDGRLNFFRAQIHVIMDSLPKAKDRIGAFDSMIVHINADEEIFSKRKRNLLLTEVYYNIGNEYYSLKKYGKAIQILTIPIEINRENAVAYYNRGCAYQSADSLDRALEDYNKAIFLKNDYTDAYYNRGLIFEEKKDYEPALTDFKKVADLNPPYKTDAILKVGVIYQEMGENDKAIKYFDKAIHHDSSCMEGYFLKGDLYTGIDMADSAISQFSQVLKLDTSNVHALSKRAQLYESIGKIKDAEDDYKKIISTDSKNKTGLKQKAREGIQNLNRVKKASKLTSRKNVNND